VKLDPTRLLGHRKLEDDLCHVHGHDGMLFHGLLLYLARGRLWHMMPTETQGGIHSINEPDEAGASDGASQVILLLSRRW